MRTDIAKALEELPFNIKEHLNTLGAECLDWLDRYLSADEEVLALSSAAAKPDVPNSCLFAVTRKRLIFVAPAPQAVGWRLSTIRRSQSFSGYFFVEGDAGDYSPGMDSTWGQTFEAKVKQAITMAVLAGE